VRIARGKKSLVKAGSYGELQNRLKQLRSGTRKGASGRGGKKYPVRYEIEETNGDIP
jgi:hypothetical protein